MTRSISVTRSSKVTGQHWMPNLSMSSFSLQMTLQKGAGRVEICRIFSRVTAFTTLATRRNLSIPV